MINFLIKSQLYNKKTAPKQFFNRVAHDLLRSSILELFGWYSIMSKKYLELKKQLLASFLGQSNCNYFSKLYPLWILRMQDFPNGQFPYIISSNLKPAPKPFFKGVADDGFRSSIMEMFGRYYLYCVKQIPKPFSQLSFKFIMQRSNKLPRWTKRTIPESRLIWLELLTYPEISFKL